MLGRLIRLTIFLAVSTASLARATTLVPLDLKALSEHADRIVYATVESTESSWTGGHDAIYTDVKLRVVRSYKGAVKAGTLLTVRKEGGVVNGIGMRVYGAPEFTPGEELVAFVEQRGKAAWIVGMTQGKLRVRTLPDGTKQVQPAELGGVHFVPGTVQPVQARPLEDFEREVRGYVQTQGAR
jgi:hypothetical protein